MTDASTAPAAAPAARTNTDEQGDSAAPDLSALLGRIERYLDALPLRDGRAEPFGPLTLYVRDVPGPPRHARPAAGRAVTAADVEAVRVRQRELGVPEVFEWVHDTAPTMRSAATAAGLTVAERPLLVLPDDVVPGAGRALPEGVTVRILAADDPCLPSALAAPHLAFAEIGTHVGTAGERELVERAAASSAGVPRTAELIRAGHTTMAAAVRDGLALCSGLFPGTAAGAAEICAVGTLPSARRQGLAAAVTALLAATARQQGAETVFIAATDEAVAKIYEGVGFLRIGTYAEAEPR